MADKNWIQRAIKRPGALRKKMGIKSGKDIPGSRLTGLIAKLEKQRKGGKLPASKLRTLRQALLARTLKKMK
jgi:hypothetical protein|tara:strand:- start:3320 stop:3535 length:216 start_codon:yes stop_codon:yes gene_type:complete